MVQDHGGEGRMRIGVPKEVKTHEYRVRLVPGSVRELVHHGHEIAVEKGAGAGIGIDDAEYVRAGATIAGSAAEVFAKAEMIVKVKEPQPAEIAMLRPGQVLFTYLHLAADKGQTEGLLRSGATCIAYETVTDARGGLPLLAPMSEVAGRMSVQVGAHCLEKEQGGKGVLLGATGLSRAKIPTSPSSKRYMRLGISRNGMPRWFSEKILFPLAKTLGLPTNRKNSMAVELL